MKNKNFVFSDWFKYTTGFDDTGQTVAYRLPLFRILKDIKAALLLSQFLWLTEYWTRKAPEYDGWFYNSNTKIEMQTGLTAKEQARARKILISSGLIFIEQRNSSGRDRSYWYKVDLDVLGSKLKDIAHDDLWSSSPKVMMTKGHDDQRSSSIVTKGHHASLPKVIMHDDQRASSLKENQEESQQNKKQKTSSSSQKNNGAAHQPEPDQVGGGGGSSEDKEYFDTLRRCGHFIKAIPKTVRIAKASGYTPNEVERLFQKILDEGNNRADANKFLRSRLEEKNPGSASDDYANSNLTDDVGEVYLGEPIYYEGNTGHPAIEDHQWLIDVALVKRPDLQMPLIHLRGFMDPSWIKRGENDYVLTVYTENSHELRKVSEFIPEIAKLAQEIGDFDFDARLYPSNP